MVDEVKDMIVDEVVDVAGITEGDERESEQWTDVKYETVWE